MSLLASAKDCLRNARACLRCAGAIRSALKTHRTSSQFPHRDWNVLLDAHCRTNGRSTDLLRPLLRHLTPVRPAREASGLLGRFKVSEQRRIAAEIARDGYYVFDTLLPEDLCDQIQAFATTTPANVFDEFGAKEEAVRYTPRNPMGRLYKFPESDLLGSHAIQQLMADDSFLRIAETYLQSEVTIGGLGGWWSAPYGNGPSSESAQLFHFDFDAPPNWLKLFAYVTDVGADTGPHVYVRGSHKAGNSRAREVVARGYQRIADNEIEQIYGADSLVEIAGRRGTVFMADTRGFHKGKHPTQGDRLLVQIIYCSPVFLDHGPRPTNIPPFGSQLSRAAGDCPWAYRRYLHG